MLAEITYIPTPGQPDNSLPPGEPGAPVHPIVIPPLPPGLAPEHPIALPPSGAHPAFPIVLPGTPEHPITAPPGTIWPPLPPSSGIAGVSLVLIWVVGVGYRWLVVQGPAVWPPTPQPK
jgi:hypothetical protein